MPRSVGAAVAAILLALASVSCVRGEDTPFTRAVAAGERAETAGKFADAHREFERAAALASRPGDRDHAEELSIRMQLKSGDIANAAKRLRAVANVSPPKRTSPHALYDLALLEEKHGDPEAARSLHREVIDRFPDSAFARRSLHFLLERADEEGGPAKGLSLLDEVEPKLAPLPIAEAVVYQKALRVEALGRKNDARRMYLDIAKRWPYPHGDLYDNALVHASAIAEEEGDYASAIADLERLLSTREVAVVMGTYQRPEYSRALFHVAEIHRDRLHDRERARATFHRFYTDFKQSPRRDDALFEEARLSDDPCEALATLVDSFPDSRYVPCAVARCKGVSRPEKSRARKDCHYSLEASVKAGSEAAHAE